MRARSSARADEAAATIDREIARHAPDDPALSTCLEQRASLAISLNDGARGLTYSLQALHHFESTGQQSLHQKSTLLEQVASAYSVKGMPDRAQEYYQQSFELLERLGRADSLDASALLSNWGVALFAAGNPLRARDLLERSIAIDLRRSLSGEHAQYTNSNLGGVLRALGRYAEADAAYDVALSVEPSPTGGGVCDRRQSTSRRAAGSARSCATAARPKPPSRCARSTWTRVAPARSCTRSCKGTSGQGRGD